MTQISNVQPGSGTSAAKSNHTLSVDRRRHASIAGVTDVCSFHETEIVLKIDSGLMILSGQGMHIAKLLLEEGKLDVDGHVDSIVYETPKQAHPLLIWKRRRG
ncbi:MAG: YabP/YqfC family sporulation protein [Clostridia bacterium]